MAEARMTITSAEGRPDLEGKTWATDDDGNHYTVEGLTFERLLAINAARARRWHPEDSTPWNLADWMVALCGEVGEAANIVKKIRRHDTGAVNEGDPRRHELYEALATELADVAIYLSLVAHEANVDLPQAITDKFNATSERYGFPERLP